MTPTKITPAAIDAALKILSEYVTLPYEDKEKNRKMVERILRAAATQV